VHKLDRPRPRPRPQLYPTTHTPKLCQDTSILQVLLQRDYLPKGLPLPNTATPSKEPWYKTKKGATAAGFEAVSGAFGIGSSQASPPYNHAFGAASGAAGLAGAAAYFLPGKRSLEILKSRNAVEMLHAKRSLEMLKQRDEDLDGLLARHTVIDERNAY